MIDEIGTQAETMAARTIAQRGVQLIATAHGGHLENIMNNPSLLDLIGGIQRSAARTPIAHPASHFHPCDPTSSAAGTLLAILGLPPCYKGDLVSITNADTVFSELRSDRSVTLGDEEARRRESRKTVRERAGPPTFDVAIELLGRRRWCIYPNIASAVDRLLLGTPRFPPVTTGLVGQAACFVAFLQLPELDDIAH